jgi:hypothetical protein
MEMQVRLISIASGWSIYGRLVIFDTFEDSFSETLELKATSNLVFQKCYRELQITCRAKCLIKAVVEVFNVILFYTKNVTT